MAVNAKFRVSRVTTYHPGGLDKALEDGSPVEVEMTPDYAQSRNAEWAAATPSGVCRLTISNPDAIRQFVASVPEDQDVDSAFLLTGKPVTLTFSFDEE